MADCLVPVMDGYEATRALRQRPELRDLRRSLAGFGPPPCITAADMVACSGLRPAARLLDESPVA